MNAQLAYAQPAPNVDPHLARHYNVQGPRYTSYPTANHFSSEFGAAAYAREARRSNEEPMPRSLSLYVHVPFCFSPCFYCGCTRLITRDSGRADSYLDFLEREIQLQSELFDSDRSVVQLHLGGGTPTFLSSPQLERLLTHLRMRFNFVDADAGEFSIEIDPRTVDFERLRQLRAQGFNRVSFGLQDLDPEVQAAVNRVQPLAQSRAVLEQARALGFRSLNVDLIYGLPRQTVASFERTLAQIIALRPDRIAAYSYAHMPQMFKAQKHIDEAELPDPERKLRLLELTVAALCAAGYVYVGMDHFALPDDELVCAQRAGTLQRNFQGYSTHAECDLVGMGMSAISAVGDGYAQNEKDLKAYFAALSQHRLPVVRGHLMSADDHLRRELINQLMCHGLIDVPQIEAAYGICFNVYFAAELERLEPLIADNLVQRSSQAIRLTAPGRLLMRLVAMTFDAYLRRGGAAPQSFSRVI